ncbi:MAG: hypothetical protein Q9178_000156 [Gyalolechia marmorata]
MSSDERNAAIRSDSPDPSSHSTNIYDLEDVGGESFDEEDDDDMDFEPMTDDSEDVEFFDPIDETEAEFLGMRTSEGARPVLTHQANALGDPPQDDDLENGSNTGRGSYPPIPSEEGKRLMSSGTFGETGSYEGKLGKRKDRLARRLIYREMGVSQDSPGRANRLISQGLIPSSKADTIIHYNARCYSGQFSDDGNFFFCCGQDFRVRMYDTSNPYKWRYYKTAEYPYGQWTITDASLSPDNRFLAYSSIRSVVFLAPTDPTLSTDPIALDFAYLGQAGRRRQFSGGYSHFGIWSIRFSGDGREVVAGTSDHSVYVYDIEAKQSILRIPGHNDDVNAVCFGDNSSPHILYSGSDDTLIKVWDRRSMGDSREAGVFMGHTEGLTYVDSKGDGRYVLSNGKDQTMKLWDLRKMMSTEKASEIDVKHYSTNFDYRFMPYSGANYKPHPWHPNAPVVAATSWNGWGMQTGTCTTHSWNDDAEDDEGEPKMGVRVNQLLEEDESLYDHPPRGGRTSRFRSRLRSQRVQASGDDDDDADGW